jgi:hypothetical protein
MKNTRLEPMKPVVETSCIGLDRLATWKELRCAMEFSSQGAFELGSATDVYRDVRSDLGAGVGVLPEELEWVALASEMQDRESN